MHAQGVYLVPSYVVGTVGMDGNSLWQLTDNSLWQATMLCCHALMRYRVWSTCSDELVAAAEVVHSGHENCRANTRFFDIAAATAILDIAAANAHGT